MVLAGWLLAVNKRGDTSFFGGSVDVGLGRIEYFMSGAYALHFVSFF